MDEVGPGSQFPVSKGSWLSLKKGYRSDNYEGLSLWLLTGFTRLPARSTDSAQSCCGSFVQSLAR